MVTGNGTIGQIIHDLLLDELLDVEYYRDLEMWYHLKVWVRFPNFSYPNPNSRVRGQGHREWPRSIDHMRLSINPPL